jgi:8-oxo-dGTP pyrophosphatase MutT (NUDIX family)
VSDDQKPRPAASVILLRKADSREFEVFLTKRPEGMPFLGGMYCYPGGVVTKDDVSDRMLGRCTGLTGEQARKIVGAQSSGRQALGFWVAAIRELFEEVGVLFAANPSGERCPIDELQTHRLAEKHQALLENSLSFVELLEGEDFYCDLTGLGHFSHWQTPAQEALRFDTRFFVAALPEDQTPLATSYEVAHSLWLTPENAMQRHERGELPMIFPTFAALRSLADFDTLKSVLREFGSGILGVRPPGE